MPSLHQWLTIPEAGEEREAHLARFDLACGTPLLAAAQGAHAWLAGG